MNYTAKYSSFTPNETFGKWRIFCYQLLPICCNRRRHSCILRSIWYTESYVGESTANGWHANWWTSRWNQVIRLNCLSSTPSWVLIFLSLCVLLLFMIQNEKKKPPTTIQSRTNKKGKIIQLPRYLLRCTTAFYHHPDNKFAVVAW